MGLPDLHVVSVFFISRIPLSYCTFLPTCYPPFQHSKFISIPRRHVNRSLNYLIFSGRISLDTSVAMPVGVSGPHTYESGDHLNVQHEVGCHKRRSFYCVLTAARSITNSVGTLEWIRAGGYYHNINDCYCGGYTHGVKNRVFCPIRVS